MSLALELAREALRDGETPVGCVVTDAEGRVVGRGRNRRERERSAVAHAEILAIGEACRSMGDWRLTGCRLYVTLEPCPMCAGAVMNARIERLYYGAREPASGSCGSVVNLFMENYGCGTAVVGGVLESECAEVMSEFFQLLRRKRGGRTGVDNARRE
jgi:tRNA(adenine34) deaminase